jgi:membrane protease YdiL (CAAX protease family)
MSEKPCLRDVFGVFVFYFLAQIALAPLLIQLIHWIATGQWTGAVDWAFGVEIRPWLNLFMILVLAATISLYVFWIEKRTLNVVWGDFALTKKLFLKIFGYWCIAYPIVSVVNNGINYLMEKWVTFPVTDQVAVEQVKSAFAQPVLYALTSLGITILVPAVEEIVFRGFLQQWLKRYFSVYASVIITAIVFAFFHYSDTQGWMNVEIIVALFVFSLFLGGVRERYQSLNASIMLHAIFNGMTLLFLTIQENTN